MSAPATRGAAIAAKCRDCIADGEMAGTWKQQVSACPVTDCPLWRYRPIARSVPAFIAARDASRLPLGWRSLPHDAVIAIVTGKTPDSLHGCAVDAIGRASQGLDGATYPPAEPVPESAHAALPEGGAP